MTPVALPTLIKEIRTGNDVARDYSLMSNLI